VLKDIASMWPVLLIWLSGLMIGVGVGSDIEKSHQAAVPSPAAFTVQGELEDVQFVYDGDDQAACVTFTDGRVVRLLMSRACREVFFKRRVHTISCDASNHIVKIETQDPFGE
jgi:YD repeat-containing protein